jgi:NAD(P)-dependent dehydrogenase (short-subunit alcohol dehydrogenase family)/acyl carrier protein
VPVSSDASYLITGGSGALGLHTAAWLADKGAGCIVLASRRGAIVDNLEALNSIRAYGCRIEEFKCDVAKREDVSRLMKHIGENLPPLRGVFHAAGVLDDATIPEMTREKYERVIYPKALGAHYLHEMTEGAELDWFVLYSSAASLLGSGGQANYAASNMMLNALAAHRRVTGLPALSVCWGPWSDGGMASSDSKRGARLAAGGILEIDPRTALSALDKAAVSGVPVAGLMAIDWKLYLSARGGYPGDYLSRYSTGKSSAGETGSSGDSELSRILDGYTPDRRERLEEALCVVASATLGFADASRISTDQPLMEQGFDSLMAVEVRNRLMRETGAELSASFLFSYPTIDKIADWFEENLAPSTNDHENNVSELLDDIDSLLE